MCECRVALPRRFSLSAVHGVQKADADLQRVVRQLVESGHCVVAAARSNDRAADVFSDLGIAGCPALFVRGGVDVTDASSLPSDLLRGVTQVVSALGPVFGRTAEGDMG